MSNMLIDISRRMQNNANPDAQAYGARVEQLFQDTRTERELTDYIILDKSEFPATNVINFMHTLGITPSKIVELSKQDAFFNTLLLDAGFLLDDTSTLSDDNMVQIFKILLFKDYEGQP